MKILSAIAKIVAWAKKLLPCAECEGEVVEEAEAEEAAEEVPAEEAVEEEAAQEAPVAEEKDFEG